MVKIVNHRLMDEDNLAADFIPQIGGVFRESDNPSKIWCTITLSTENVVMTTNPIRFEEIKSLNFTEYYAGFYCPKKAVMKNELCKCKYSTK